MSMLGQLYKAGVLRDDFRSIFIGNRFYLRDEEVEGNASAAQALSVVVPVSRVTTVNSDDGFTLADGKTRQIKIIIAAVIDSGDSAVITPDNFLNGTTITLAAAGDSAILWFDGTNWICIGGLNPTVA